MTDLLEQAFEKASHLPPGEQDAFARWVLAELDSERKWDASFASSNDVLSKLAEEAKEEYQSGETEPLDPDHL